MKPQKRIKTLSKITKTLLAEGESERADFKKIPDGISSDYLVSFANNIKGGTILAGVSEVVSENGTQIGIVSGCDVSDSAILQVINKAIGCFPPVSVEVYIENTADKPILRIYIPESENKPHCTPKGVYCRRDGNRNRPLYPSELLRIFLDSEGRAFAERFEQSAQKIANDLASLESSLESSIDSIGSKLGWAEYQLDDTESLLASINSKINSVSQDTQDSSTRLRTLFRQDDRDDPVRSKVKENFLNELIKYLSENPQLFANAKNGDQLNITTSGKVSQELNKEEMQSIFDEAVRKIIDDHKSVTASTEKEPNKKK